MKNLEGVRMVTDKQVRWLFSCLDKGMSVEVSAMKAGMSEKTARKYRGEWKLPGEMKKDRTWRTREDPFSDVWEEAKEKLEGAGRLQVKTLFEWLCEKYPGRFKPGQLRSLERKVRQWRALEGPAKEVFFPQIHYPARLSQSDFTHMTDLGITIAGELLRHMVFHFVLTYSNWEHVSVCYSESFESLSEGLQEALFALGGTATEHQTDRLTAAVNKEANPEEFTSAYRALLSHYNVKGRKIQAGKANEDGDVEQSHYRFKQAVEQALILRGNKDFENVSDYEQFLQTLTNKRNASREERFREEKALLQPLPQAKLNTTKRFRVRVNRNSLIFVQHNTYSVHSRLIGEEVEVRVYAQYLEVWYAQKCVDKLRRQRGTKKSHIEYRHIIDWLVRKPGAFENYLYKQDLFPTTTFRTAYDLIHSKTPLRASREYLKILELAARESESKVEALLRDMIKSGEPPSAASITERLKSETQPLNTTEVRVDAINLCDYDTLLDTTEEMNYEQEQLEICAITGAERAALTGNQAVL